MTSGLNTDGEDKTVSGGGFWSGAKRHAPEAPASEDTDRPVAPEAQPGSEAAQPWLTHAEPKPALEAGEEGAVPSWLGLSHEVDAPAHKVAARVPTDLAPAAPLPRSVGSTSDVVVRDPHEVAVPAAPPVEAAVPTNDPGTPAIEASSVPDLPWDDELSWDDEDGAAHGALDGYALDEPEPASSGEPQEYIEADLGYEGGPSLFDGGDTGYLVNPTIYDEGEGLAPDARRKRLRIAVVAVAVVTVLGIGYGLGVRHFWNRLLPNTRINGLEVANLTAEEAQEALESETRDYACDISVDDFALGVAGADVSLERNEQAMVQAAFDEQSAYRWPLALLFAPNEQVNDELTFDDAALASLVGTAADDFNQQQLPTQDAHIDYNEETGLFEVSGTTTGEAVDAEAVAQAAAASVRAFERTCTPSKAKAMHKATVLDIPSFAKTAEAANRVRTTDVPVLVNGEPVIVSEAAQNVEWVKVGEGPSVVVDQDAVRYWAESFVADAVFHSDDWSNYYLNVDEFVAGFSDRLANGVVDGYEAPTIDELRTEGESREKAYAKGGWDSELGRYIDVDLESQFARLFDESGNVIWESAFVSGDMYEGRSTVVGIFEIYAMETNTVLVGLDYNNDGQPDYESFVNYWMPFYGGYGLHDATWRSNFGGEYYYYNGSHGCVNLPFSKAEELYNITHVGEKVNVHW